MTKEARGKLETLKGLFMGMTVYIVLSWDWTAIKANANWMSWTTWLKAMVALAVVSFVYDWYAGLVEDEPTVTAKPEADHDDV